MKILVISPSPSHLAMLGELLRGIGDPAPTVLTAEGGMSRLRGLVAVEVPDLVVIDSMACDPEELVDVEALNLAASRLGVIVLCAQQSPEFLIRAMRAGVREVLASPPTAEDLIAAVHRLAQRGVTPVRGAARTLAFIPCKGGSGATFIACNVAWMLAAAGRSVLLVDMNLQFGDAVLFLHDTKPRTTVADVARNVSRLDASLLMASLVHVNPQLGILAAPEDPGQAADVRPERIEALLGLARSMFDFVVLDMGRSLDAVAIKALDQVQTIYPVMQTTLPFVRDAHRLLTVFQSLGYPRDKIELVVNRYERGGEIGLDDIERTLGCPARHVVPNSFEAVAAAVNHGRPIAEVARGNPVTRALQDMVDSLLPKEAPQPSWSGWLRRREQRA